jgi:lysophospholipase L1-like esterase
MRRIQIRLSLVALLALNAGFSHAQTNQSIPTLWIIGDSTVRNGQADGANGQWGWGDEIAPYFRTDRINIVNRAHGGTSSRTYFQHDWPGVVAIIHPGDFVLMQFGHNDNGPLDDAARARGTLPGNGEDTRAIDNPITHQHETVHTYGWYLRQMIDQAREHGATPIVLSLIPRKTWDGNRIHREDYVLWAHQAADAGHAQIINLNEIIARQYEKLGPAAVEPLFADPHTHTSLAGAQLNAKSVVEGLKGLKHDPLKKYLSPESKPLQPFHDPGQNE